MPAYVVRAAALTFLAAGSLAAASCGGRIAQSSPAESGPTSSPPLSTPFSSDLQFLNAHTHIVLLTGADGAQVAVAPVYQGRVMTSTTGGSDAPSFGWIGRAAVESGRHQSHMNVFGGEDRFWLGPEGGQFALYFRPGEPFDLDHWQVPPAFDWDAWDVATQSETEVRFHKHMSLVNYSRTPLDIDVERTVRMVSAEQAAASLGPLGSGVRMVAFESENSSRMAGGRPGSRRRASYPSGSSVSSTRRRRRRS